MVYQTMKTIQKVPKHFNDVQCLSADKNKYKPMRHTGLHIKYMLCTNCLIVVRIESAISIVEGAP